MTNITKIQKIFEHNKGLITREDIVKENIPSWFLTDFVRKNHLVKLASGIYALSSYPVDSYFLVQKRYPKAVFSHYSALYLNKLTNRIPDYTEVTIPYNYRIRKESFNNLVVHKERNTFFDEYMNTECVTIFGNVVRTFSKEKAIVEMIRKRSDYDGEIFIKALYLYKKSKDKNLKNLYEYARLRKIEEEVYRIMEVIQIND